jgi:hypothetical protein
MVAATYSEPATNQDLLVYQEQDTCRLEKIQHVERKRNIATVGSAVQDLLGQDEKLGSLPGRDENPRRVTVDETPLPVRFAFW